MFDQAEKLRKLATLALHPQAPACQVTVLSGCKGGVGVTTLSLNLAVAMYRDRGRVLLVDGTPFRGDLARIYRLRSDYDINDFANGTCSLSQALATGPHGLPVLPRFEGRALTSSFYLQLVRHIRHASQDFDHILIDAGCYLPATETLWSAADQVVLISTADQMAITDCYAFVKSMVKRSVIPECLGLVINRCTDESRVLNAMNKLAQSCARFLELVALPLGGIPDDPIWESAAGEARSLSCASPHSEVTQLINELGSRLTSDDLHQERLNSELVR